MKRILLLVAISASIFSCKRQESSIKETDSSENPVADSDARSANDGNAIKISWTAYDTQSGRDIEAAKFSTDQCHDALVQCLTHWIDAKTWGTCHYTGKNIGGFYIVLVNGTKYFTNSENVDFANKVCADLDFSAGNNPNEIASGSIPTKKYTHDKP